MLREAFKRIKLSEKFYQSYGHHIRIIELSLIIITLVIYETITHVLAPLTIAIDIWIVILVPIFLLHVLIYQLLGQKELYPENLLFLDKVHRYFIALLMFIFVALFATAFALAVYFPQWANNNGAFFANLEFSLNLILPLMASSVFLLFGSLTRFRKARLYIKLALAKAISLRHARDELERKRIVKRFLGLFDKGLAAYNEYLNFAMLHVNLCDLKEYSKVLYCEFLAGKDEEIIVVTNQIELFLKSLQKVESKDELREALTALINIKMGRNEKEYPISELYSMVTVVTQSG